MWQVKGAMTLPPAPATKVGVPHSSPVFGLEWDTQHSQRPCLRFVIRSVAEGSAVRLSMQRLPIEIDPQPFPGLASPTTLQCHFFLGLPQASRLLPRHACRRGEAMRVGASMSSCYTERRTADPSATLGMTKGGPVISIGCGYWDGRTADPRLALPRHACAGG